MFPTTELPEAHGVFRIAWGYQNMKVMHLIKNYSMSLRNCRNEIVASLASKKRQNMHQFKRQIQAFYRAPPNAMTGITANDAELEMIHRLTLAASFKDPDTGMHLKRMSHYAKLIAQAMGTSLEFQEAVFHAAPMHDIGKLGIPDAILLKRGRLTDAEMKMMHTHPDIGYKILCGSQSVLVQLAADIARTHHEKFDGSGYPSGLRGKEIPLAGRIVAVADVFDALISSRPYKKGWEFELAVKFMIACSSTHFDPECINAFLRVLPEIKKITIDFHETCSVAEA